MAMLGDPDYSKVHSINSASVKLSAGDLINSYTVLKVSFEYPSEVKYPCIPVQVDKTITIYPLKGESTITGLEYVLAREQGCKIEINSGFRIPFKHALVSTPEMDVLNKK